jgi:hypothetical protein
MTGRLKNCQMTTQMPTSGCRLKNHITARLHFFNYQSNGSIALERMIAVSFLRQVLP